MHISESEVSVDLRHPLMKSEFRNAENVNDAPKLTCSRQMDDRQPTE